jgi:hypothetical protein
MLPVDVRFEVNPVQINEGLAEAVTLVGFTANPITDEAVFTHPFASVPVTVYVVSAEGEAETTEPEVGVSPVVGE